MMKCSFDPYEGDRDYLFVSYSRADSETVKPVLEALHRHLLRIWYDEGIQTGKRWRREIARHVYQCRTCLAFHSASSAQSIHCQNEIEGALDKKKYIISVFLEKEVELDDGIRLCLHPYQSAALYEYNHVEQFVEDLVLKLKDVEDFTDCLDSTDAPEITDAEPSSVDTGPVSWSIGGSGVLTMEQLPALDGKARFLLTLES